MFVVTGKYRGFWGWRRGFDRVRGITGRFFGGSKYRVIKYFWSKY